MNDSTSGDPPAPAALFSWSHWRRWRRGWIAAALALLLAVGLLLVPQFEVLGFEAALATSIVVPLLAGLLAAGFRRSPLPAARPWRGLAGLLAAGEALALLPLLLVSLNMVRAPVCDPVEGLGFFLLLPVASTALAVVTGWFLALATRTSARATGLWVLIWTAAVALPVYRFFATPAVSFLGPFFGFYPGAIYDTLIPISERLWTYRLTNLVEAVTLLVLARLAWDAATQRLSLRRLVRHRAAPYAVVPLLGACLAGYLLGPTLGHRTDAETLASRLGAHRAGRTCDVYGPRAAPPEELILLADECDFRVRQMRDLLRLPGDGGRIAVFAFGSEADKALGMGAGRTSIAKPWRREVYVVLAGLPHPVLKHELAHVLLGELGRGPFGVPAHWGGLLPLPGLIEGAATALAWEPDVLTPHGWAAALERTGLLPPAETLLGVGFLGEAAGPAYTAMGSFVRWLLETQGTQPFFQVYRDGDFGAAYGRALPDLWNDWRAWLGTLPLTEAELAAAQARFDVPGFFAVRCPHAVAKAVERRDHLRAAGDVAGALAAQSEACRLSGQDPWHRVALLDLLEEAGRTDEALRLADELLAEPRLGSRRRELVRQLRADALWRAGDADAAHAEYEALLPRAVEPAERRLLQVKRHGTADRESEAYVRAYLEAAGAGTAAAAAAAAAAERYAAERPEDPIAHYLVGRARLNVRRFAEAEAPLWYALENGLADAELRDEAVFLLATLAWRAGDAEQLELDATVLLESDSARYRAEAEDWLLREAWLRSR